MFEIPSVPTELANLLDNAALAADREFTSELDVSPCVAIENEYRNKQKREV